MGVARSLVRVLLNESKRSLFHGSLLTLGAQDVFVTEEELREDFADAGIKLPAGRMEISPKPDLAKGSFISDRALWTAYGFDDFKSVDASAYEGCDIVFDLNSKETPAELTDRWDVILNGGTVEHVFHVPNALANLHRMLKVGGRVIHTAPSSNHIDHGFYMFSPTLFSDYYRANKYEINTLNILRYRGGLDTKWEISDYVPGSLSRVSMGGLDDAMYLIIVVATKTAQSTCDTIPQQGMYADALWVSKEPGSDADALSSVLDPDFQGKGLGLKIKYSL